MEAKRSSCSFPLFTILLFLFISLVPKSVIATDTISANQSLSGNQKLISQKGKFVLGFFRPDNSSSNWYIGIWYGKISAQTIVWVASRENPVTDPTVSKLMISGDGNLVLLDQFKTLVWSSNSKNTSSNSTVAVILDTGNFILRDKSNSSKVIWQSFDHPANTWLPGGKLGLNKITGVNQRLISWKDENNPTAGLFSLELDPNGDQYILQWNNSVQYWTSGKWNGQIFELVPEMGPKNSYPESQYGFEYISDESGIYFTYWIKDSVVTQFVIDVSGQIKFMTWTEVDEEWLLFWAQPKVRCEVYALCGPFGTCNENFESLCQCVKGFTVKNPIESGLEDYSGGCVRNTPLQCESNRSYRGNEDKFYEMSNMVVSTNSRTVEINNTKDCELSCLSNCSCTAYSYDNGCSLWFGDLINLQINVGTGGETLYLRLAASELPDVKKNKNKGLIIGVALGGCFVIVFLAFGLFLILRKRRRTGELKRVDGGLAVFRYGDLQYITKNFSEMIGKGGFGSVFKGSLLDSTVVAVKRLEGISQGDKHFRAEVGTIGTIQHLNLIRLFGFCSENGKSLLVYEYMSMGSLDRHLFGNGPTILSWDFRYQIALGVSRGLLYLHDECRDCIIHCDIKPENILLDEAFVPKIADFGLAKLLGRDFSRVLTTMRGTRGYLAPEWIAGTAITVKADVYSFGMMLLEIISGKRNLNSDSKEGGGPFFPALAVRKLIEGDIMSLLDPRLRDDVSEEEIIRVCKVGIWCIQDEENCRPSMAQVVQILEGHLDILDINMPPIPRSFKFHEEKLGSINFFSNLSSS
ncbi:hypothetical protein LUZ60_007783 [Juncus effusus]|nr:hypothetical protein LUZ60_007783 [Juncus effusus]